MRTLKTWHINRRKQQQRQHIIAEKKNTSRENNTKRWKTRGKRRENTWIQCSHNLAHTHAHAAGVGWKSEMEREKEWKGGRKGGERQGIALCKCMWVNVCESCVCVRAMVPWLMLQLIFIHTVYTLANEQANNRANERTNEWIECERVYTISCIWMSMMRFLGRVDRHKRVTHFNVKSA